MSRSFSLNPRVAFRFVLTALIALLGFTSCSRSLFGKRDKQDVVTDDPSEDKEVPDVRINPTRPPEHPIRVLYGVPPRTYQWGR